MNSSVFRCVSLACLLSGTLASGQEAPPTAPAATAPPDPASVTPSAPVTPKALLTQWGTDFSFLFDGYVDWNYNDPASGFNGLQNFALRADTAHVNIGKITIDHAPAPLGFHLDVGFGETMDVIHAADRDPNAWKYFEQAYIDLKPKSWHGLEIDAGQFVTSAGAEVIETNQNWNYSRSLLFVWAIPYYHFGVRAGMPIGTHFTAGVQVVNGWSNIEPLNSGKTVGLNGAYAWKKVIWTNNYYVGPEKPHTTVGLRNFFDTVVQVNATDKFSYSINGDYGRDRNIGPGASVWAGVAAAARYAIGEKYAIASRIEYFDDRNGFATGTAQHVEEFTLTGEYKMNGWLMSRLEFRNDRSDQPFFETSKPGSGAKTQPTVLLGLIVYVAPRK
jgi:hypothetical protein